MPQSSPLVTPRLLTLRHAPFTLDLAPDVGGAIAGFSCDWDGPFDLMRRLPDAALAAHDVRAAGCFPMLPYSNRMRECTLAFAGKRYRLAPNFGSHPHSIHGNAWQRGWTVESADPAQATLLLDHGAEGHLAAEWPFPYRARQRFALADDGLTIEMSLENTGATPMPAGMGLHPYFPRAAGTRLTAATRGVWRNDEAMMPVGLDPVPPAWNFEEGRLVAPLAVDNCFAGWQGNARIEWPDRGVALEMTADPVFGHLVVYVPPGKTFFCVEPTSHANDGMNMLAKGRTDTGVVVLAPGERLAGSVLFAVTRNGPGG